MASSDVEAHPFIDDVDAERLIRRHEVDRVPQTTAACRTTLVNASCTIR